jgi:hypothetical protein
MKASSVVAVAIGCTIVLGCDLQPSVIFVANGTLFQMLQLTDARDDCPESHRLCYLTAWDGSTYRGCWAREQGNIHTHFPFLGDKLVPVGQFHRTTLAEYRNLALD